MTPARRRSALAIGGLAVSLLGVLGLLLIARLPDSRGWGAAENWGHLPLFGVLALVLLGVWRTLVPALQRSPRGAYALAFASTALLGALSEGLQGLAGRDMSAGDWLHDLAGAALFLGFVATFDTCGGAQRPCRRRRIGVRAALVVALIASAWPVLDWMRVYAERDRAFPRLLDFESTWESRLWVLQSAQLDAVPPPPGWPQPAPGDRVGQLTFSPDAAFAPEFTGYSGFFIDELHPDWRGYDALVFLVFVSGGESEMLSLRIEDEQHQTNNSAPDRFNLDFVARPGLQEIRVPLDAIERAPATRRNDLGAIRVLHLFVIEPKREFSVYVDSFRLE